MRSGGGFAVSMTDRLRSALEDTAFLIDRGGASSLEQSLRMVFGFRLLHSFSMTRIGYDGESCGCPRFCGASSAAIPRLLDGGG